VEISQTLSRELRAASWRSRLASHNDSVNIGSTASGMHGAGGSTSGFKQQGGC
jgi:hypothetical protein